MAFKIRNRTKMAQVTTFENFDLGRGRYPTDVDGLIEWKNKAYVVLELKFGYKEMPTGQELALTRLVDDLDKVKPALLIIGSHLSGEGEDIDAGNALVARYRFEGKWYSPKRGERTVRDVTEIFLNNVDRGDY